MANAARPVPGPRVDWERVGATLRALRKARGASTAEMAAALGVTHSHVSNIEAGRRPLSDALLVKAADVLVVPQLAILRPKVTDQDGAA